MRIYGQNRRPLQAVRPEARGGQRPGARMQVPWTAYRVAWRRRRAQFLPREESGSPRRRRSSHHRRQGTRRHSPISRQLRFEPQVRVQVQGPQQQAGRDTGGSTRREAQTSGRGQPEAQEGCAVLHREHQEPRDNSAEGGGLGRARVPYLQYQDKTPRRVADISHGERNPDRHPLSYPAPQAGVLQGVEQTVVPHHGEDPRRGTQRANESGDDGGGDGGCHRYHKQLDRIIICEWMTGNTNMQTRGGKETQA